MMEHIALLSLFLGILALSSIVEEVYADSPYKYFDLNLTYGIISPLGVRQRVRSFCWIVIFLSDRRKVITC